MLSSDGVKGIIFDLDSTLLAPRSGRLTPEVSQWLTDARNMFRLVIVSNNNHLDYLADVEKLLDMPLIGKAAKPSRKAFRKAQEILELNPEEIVVIGDRPLTDVLGGQRAGMKTLLVMPLKTMQEAKWIKFFRKLERFFIRF
jgi:HAD superfamily phosphatase (TIGR01668 family)